MPIKSFIAGARHHQSWPKKSREEHAFMSQRWRFIWCTCPSFNFDEREFPPPPSSLVVALPESGAASNSSSSWRRRPRSLHVGSAGDDLTALELKASMRVLEELDSHPDKWIAFALEKNVKELSIIIAEMKNLIAIVSWREKRERSLWERRIVSDLFLPEPFISSSKLLSQICPSTF